MRHHFVWSALLSSLLACSACAQGGHTRQAPPPPAGQAAAVFAGGCFWCMETAFEGMPGVFSVTSGFTGGRVNGASYDEVSSGGTGHVEAVRVVYDPNRVSYAQLLDVFWHNIDPTEDRGQFCDLGEQYRAAIFVANPEERRLAEESLRRVHERLQVPVVTTIRPAAPFWIAEAYHQDFFRTHREHYLQ